jgi:hypothetical protein
MNFHIPYQKELHDSLSLVNQLYNSGFVNRDTVLVNYFPDYSSRLTQLINHKLSFLNDDELFQQLSLEVPYPLMSQVWNPYSGAYELWDRYLHSWVKANIRDDQRYVFVSTEPFLLAKLSVFLKHKADYRFVSLYREKKDPAPHIYIKEYDKLVQGPLLFEWQNINHPLMGLKPKT